MPHRRDVGSRRNFKDGLYRMQVRVRDTELDSKLALYKRFAKPGDKFRYITGEDGWIYIYRKDTEETTHARTD